MSVAKNPGVVEQCDVNMYSFTSFSGSQPLHSKKTLPLSMSASTWSQQPPALREKHPMTVEVFESSQEKQHRGILGADTCFYRSVRERAKRRNEQRAGRQVGAERKRRFPGVARLAGR
ncbi:hypothetical protein TNCV_2127271 [Trichonephila clavipes]|nr:hypothetical protein TNCV_2127271 [Trichonephila clavipes]